MIHNITMIFTDKNFRALCKKPYYNHPHGCPNYNKKKGCPPKQKTLDKIYSGDFYLIFTCFDLATHAKKMKKKHPKWTDRQCRCCLYWQGTARKNLRMEIQRFKEMLPKHYVSTCPEAMGVNVTALMKENAGVELEWPPEYNTYQVAIAGLKKLK